MAEPIDWGEVRDEVVGHLQALIRLDTTNPPGNETVAAAYLARVLRKAGIDVEIVEPAPGRATIVARLRAPSPTKPPFMMMGHTDVVGVERAGWEHDPFAGELVDGFVWGRGALDMKNQVAAQLVVMLLLQRRGVRLERDVIMASFADEEAGGELGAAWLWENRRDLLDAEFAINEGGGRSIPAGDSRVYLCQVGEKGASRLKITARGEPGHASSPRPDTAMVRMAQAVLRLHKWQPEIRLTPAVRQMLETLAGAMDVDDAARVRAMLANPTPETIANLPLSTDTIRGIRTITGDTAVPTIIQGGIRINVIPSQITLEVDGRILPGTDPEEWRARVQTVVGDDVSVELLSRNTGIETDAASPFFDAIQETIVALDPAAVVAPYLSGGGTDARHLPEIKVYGFYPYGPSRIADSLLSTMHGHNERIAVDDLQFGVTFLYEVVHRFCAVPSAHGEGTPSANS